MPGETEFDDIMDRIKLQNKEFDAVSNLSKKYDLLCQVPVVDDDYPEYRSRYEGALHGLIRALQENGRIQ